ncbi:imelysin family protein [Colwelliaceae bacterium MEBiC 14330]
MKYCKSLMLTKKLVSVAVTSVLLMTGCGEKTTSSSGAGFNNNANTNTDFDQGKLVTSIVDNVITPNYQQFSALANEQIQAIDAYCAQETLFAQGDSSQSLVDESMLNAQQSWRNAMDSWQKAEVMQFPQFLIDGGLRNNIYSWPIKNTCGVDLDVTYFKSGEVNGQAYDISKRTASRKSMVALEYLLFNETLTHTCTGSVAPDSWDNQTEQYRKVARCEYATEVAKDVADNAQQLLTQWLGDDGVSGYAQTLKSAGIDDNEFATDHDAVNKISDAIFYLDLFTKDGKLAEPLGIFANECGSQACPEVVESTYSQHSIDNIINNLQALKEFMQGQITDENSLIEEATGFRDYLIDVGDQETADSIDANLTTAIANAQAYEMSLAETLISDEDKVIQTHSDVKNITDKLKTDFINSLALELPKTAAGDND